MKKKMQGVKKLDILLIKNHLSNIWYKELSLTITILLTVSIQIVHGTNIINNNTKNYMQQQEITISGTVTDKDGPLVGASILVKGTSDGTITDIDGKYTIRVDNQNVSLIFSYVGYANKEVTVGNQQEINISLITNSQLDDVVVIGYTSRKKGDVTGSISTIKNEDITRTGSQDLTKSLSGKISGLIISDRGGQPGSTSESTLLIRGKSTLNNNSPLILIDGIVAESFSHLAPQDIENLSVLKDGAAAIYGSRAANGVILITTRRGKTGKPKINFSTSYSLSSFSTTPTLMNSEQFAIYQNEIAQRQGEPLPYSTEAIGKYRSGEDPLNFPNTDWAKLTFADYSPETRNSLSISGGGNNIKYFVSGDMTRQAGMYKTGTLRFDQNQVRSNIDINLYKNVRLGVDLLGRFGNTNAQSVDDDANYIYKHIYTNLPTEVGFYPNGLPGWGGENGANTHVMSSDKSGYNRRLDNDLRGKISLDIALDEYVKGLSIKTFLGYRRQSHNQKSWYTPWTVYQLQSTGIYEASTGFSQRGEDRILRETFWNYDELMLNGRIHYKKSFNNDHNVSGFVAYEQTTSEQNTFWTEKKGFPTKTDELFAGNTDSQSSNGDSSEWARLNYFGTLSYDFMKKYYVDVTLRYDGSSNFGPNKRFGFFPGVQLAYSIKKEGFLENVKWVNALKIRASWSIMGNDRVEGFQYLAKYNYSGSINAAQPNYYIFGNTSYNGYSSIGTPVSNPNITWETADMKNIGLNFNLLDFRITGDFNYFYQKREGILVQRNASIPDFAGLTLPQENLGKVDNFGWELELGWNDKIGKDINYNLGFNFTNARNEVVYIDEASNISPNLKREGYPMDSYIVYPTKGLFKNQAEVDNEPAKLDGTVPGEPHYIDTNGDGKIDVDDRIRIYDSNVPEIQYGFYGGVKYKNLSLNFLFQGQAKVKILVYMQGIGSLPNYMYNQRWTAENTNAYYPRAFAHGDKYSSSFLSTVNFQGADFWYRDASFIRLKEVEIAYTISKKILKYGNIRVYVKGYNLLTMFSEIYDLGLDPEASGYNQFIGSTYPSLRTYTVGANFTF